MLGAYASGSGRLACGLGGGGNCLTRFSGVWGEGQQPVRCLACLTGCTDDGAIVLAHDLGPGSDVVGVADGRGDAEGGDVTP